MTTPEKFIDAFRELFQALEAENKPTTSLGEAFVALQNKLWTHCPDDDEMTKDCHLMLHGLQATVGRLSESYYRLWTHSRELKNSELTAIYAEIIRLVLWGCFVDGINIAKVLKIVEESEGKGPYENLKEK